MSWRTLFDFNIFLLLLEFELLGLSSSLDFPTFETPISSLFLGVFTRKFFTAPLVLLSNLVVEVNCDLLHLFVFPVNDFAVSVIPFLTTCAFDPVLAIHSSVNSRIVIDLEAVVALHILKERRMTFLTKSGSLTILHFDGLEDSSQNLLCLLFIYQQSIQIVLLSAFNRNNLGRHHSKWTELIETLVDDFWNVLNCRKFTRN